MAVTFDGDNLLITLPAATAEVSAKIDLYSDWKEWFKTGSNSKYPLAFDTTGGDPTTLTKNVSAFFFLRNDNGWRIKPAEEDGETVIDGNLYPRDPTLPMFVPTTGGYTHTLTIERDASSVVESGADVTLIRKYLTNKTITDPVAGNQIVYDDDGVTPLIQGNLFEDAAGTQPYRGQGAERREKLE